MAWLRVLDRWLDRLYSWCGYAAAALLVILTLLIITSIVGRLMGTYTPGLTEYSGYAMAGASFLAFAYTFRAGGHIRVAILMNAMHGRTRWLLQLWCFCAASFFAGYLAYYLVKMTRVSYKLGDRSEGADAILIWIPQTLVAVGSVVFAICVVHSLVRFLAGVGEEEGGAKLAASSKEP